MLMVRRVQLDTEGAERTHQNLLICPHRFKAAAGLFSALRERDEVSKDKTKLLSWLEENKLRARSAPIVLFLVTRSFAEEWPGNAILGHAPRPVLPEPCLWRTASSRPSKHRSHPVFQSQVGFSSFPGFHLKRES